jgi:steroid delta-isomerase-like uncharacterized protein
MSGSHLGVVTRSEEDTTMRRLSLLASLLAAAAVIAAAALVAVAQEAAPATPAALPPLLTDWGAAMATHDPDRILALYAADAVWEEVPLNLVLNGSDEIRAHLGRLFAATPDIAYDVTGGFATGDRAAAEWIVSGTLTGDFPGLPPGTGQPFAVRGVSIFELEDGKIARYTEYWDGYSFLVQLGALPAPGTPAAVASTS